jgi:hypothetical protein
MEKKATEKAAQEATALAKANKAEANDKKEQE